MATDGDGERTRRSVMRGCARTSAKGESAGAKGEHAEVCGRQPPAASRRGREPRRAVDTNVKCEAEDGERRENRKTEASKYVYQIR